MSVEMILGLWRHFTGLPLFNVLRQYVKPESDAQAGHHQTPEEQNRHLHPHDTIICPRCGTNNQNWTYIRANLRANWLRQPTILGGMLVILALLASSWRQMQAAKVPLQYQVILISLGLFLFLFILPQSLIGLWIYLFRLNQRRRFLPNTLSIWEYIPLPIRVYSIYFLALFLVRCCC